MYNVSVKSQEKIKKYFNNSLDKYTFIMYNISVKKMKGVKEK